MNDGQESYPTCSQLWRGVTMGTIAHAISQAPSEVFYPDQQWHGRTYTVNPEQGARGAVTFEQGKTIGAFYDVYSSRNPWSSETPYDIRPFFNGIPADLFALARQETLQYMIYGYLGKDTQVVTAAFWSFESRLTAAETWPNVVEHGAHLLKRQLMEPAEAITEWEESYELSTAQAALLRSSFDRKMLSPDTPLIAEDWERRILTAQGDAGIDLSREILEAVGIALP